MLSAMPNISAQTLNAAQIAAKGARARNAGAIAGGAVGIRGMATAVY